MSPMHIAVAIFVIVVAIAAYDVWKVYRAVSVSSLLIASAQAFQTDVPSNAKRILVLGDSTAASVGSPPELSVPGRLGGWLQANVENHAKSGARTADLRAQISQAKHERYDLILIQIGANDVTHWGSLSKTQEDLAHALRLSKKYSDKVILLTAGDIGKAPVFAFPLNSLLSMRTRSLRHKFMTTAEHEGTVYVDIYSRRDPFAEDPDTYYAQDGFHLSGAGYGFWFEIVKDYAQEKWPKIAE